MPDASLLKKGQRVRFKEDSLARMSEAQCKRFSARVGDLELVEG